MTREIQSDLLFEAGILARYFSALAILALIIL